MLNRINEINIIRSFSGEYRFRNGKISPKEKSSMQVKWEDKRLSFNIVVKDGRDAIDTFFPNTTDNIIALFLGELYNFDDLLEKIEWTSQSDEKPSFSYLCCMLYKKYGLNFARHINGMFSIVLRDRTSDIFLIIVDRFASSHPIYYKASDQLAFSTHFKNLLLMDRGSKAINTTSLALFLKYSYIPNSKTIIQGIYKLNPGEMIICKLNDYKIIRYIDFSITSKALSVDDAISAYSKILKKSISNQLEKKTDQTVGFFLSGGLDSSANVAIAAKLNKCSFKTFGVGFSDPKIDERPYAKIVAEHFNIPFDSCVFDGNEIEDFPKMIWYLEEPFLENGLFLTYAAFKSVQNKADILISGNCADQMFGTGGFAGTKPIALRYILEKLHLMALCKQAKQFIQKDIFYNDTVFFKLNVLLRRSIDFNDWFFWGFDNYELGRICKFNTGHDELSIFSNNLCNVPKTFADYYNYSIIHQDIEHYACQNVLVKSSKISEMFGIYGRDPYLDYDVVDFLLSLELPLKRKGGLLDFFRGRSESKYLHRLAMKQVLPHSILTKPKQGGFVNMSLLISNSLRRAHIYRYISNSDIIREYLNMTFIQQLFQRYEQLTKKNIYWVDHRDAAAGQILSLLALAIWYDIVLKGDLQSPPDITLSELIS